MYLTYEEIADKVKEQLDLEDEVFIDADEMMGHCNDAIKRCESKIHKIYEDYFLTSGLLSLTSGASEVDMPSDIYANKIRSILWNDQSSTLYEIKRVKDPKKFILIENAKVNPGSNPRYRYWIKNSAATQTGRKIMLVPAAQETTATKAIIYYLRCANRVTADDDIVDIPEFYSVIVAYMKYKCYLKEGHPNTELALQEYAAEEENMVETLTDMVPDGDNEIEMASDPYEGSEC